MQGIGWLPDIQDNSLGLLLLRVNRDLLGSVKHLVPQHQVHELDRPLAAVELVISPVLHLLRAPRRVLDERVDRLRPGKVLHLFQIVKLYLVSMVSQTSVTRYGALQCSKKVVGHNADYTVFRSLSREVLFYFLS